MPFSEKKKNPEEISADILLKKQNLGICSMSETHNHELMWAHYADQFRGICIEYNLYSALNGLSAEIDLTRLSYDENVYKLLYKNLKDRQTVKKILSVKNHRWSYEREWRFLSPKQGRMDLGDGCITCVYVGNRVDRKAKLALTRALETKNIPYKDLQIDGYSMKFSSKKNVKAD